MEQCSPSRKKECCEQEENLIALPSDKKDLLIRQCKLCKAKHFELTIDAGHFGATLTPLG